MKRVLAILSSVILLHACQKELNFSKSSPDGVVSLAHFFQKNGAPLQRFNTDASQPINFTAAKGTGVYFPANAFITATGAPVAGDVTIELKEIYTPAEMILNNTPTMSDGLPLESGGEFFIRVTKNNEALKLAPGKFLRLGLITETGADMERMQVFNGDTSAGTVDWTPADTSQPNTVTQDTLTAASFLYTFNLNWVNCDRFIDEPLIKFTAKAGNCPRIDSAVVFVHLTGQKAVMSLPRTNNGFASDYMIAAPATVVGICVVDEKIYYSIMPVTMRHGGSVTLNFSEIGEKELREKLAALD